MEGLNQLIAGFIREQEDVRERRAESGLTNIQNSELDRICASLYN